MEFIVSSKELKKNQERAIAREQQERILSEEAKEDREFELIEKISEKACWFFMGIASMAIILNFMA